MMIGWVWVFHDDECRENFEEGYFLVIAIVYSYFGIFAATIMLLLATTCIVCFGAVLINGMLEDEEVGDDEGKLDN